MILAAGFGTRLQPLTLNAPKALVKVDGTPMIKLVLARLISWGIEEVVINTHHFHDQIKEYFSQNDFGIKINLIRERIILGTGGGIKNARKYLEDSDFFLVHNVDVLCDLEMKEMLNFHTARSPIATLAVKTRNTSRPLLIDEKMNITGREAAEKNYRYAAPAGNERRIGFCGIHIISSEIFSNLTEDGFFDIFTAYFRLIREEKHIVGYDIRDSFWKDLGDYKNI
jgi:NDP-sugar pyrophosphorylase family protein